MKPKTKKRLLIPKRTPLFRRIRITRSNRKSKSNEYEEENMPASPTREEDHDDGHMEESGENQTDRIEQEHVDYEINEDDNCENNDKINTPCTQNDDANKGLLEAINKQIVELLKQQKAEIMNEVLKVKSLKDRGENILAQPSRSVSVKFQTPPYILTDQILFRSWFIRLKSEIETYEYLDIIDENVDPPSYLSDEDMKRRKTNVRNIILSRLDEKHLRLVEMEVEPMRIIKRLEAHRESKTMAGELSYLKELHNLTYNPSKSSVQDFLLNLNMLFSKIEQTDPEPYSDLKKKKMLMLAVADTFPELIVIDRAQDGRMSYERAQQILLEESALRKESELRSQTRAPHALYTKKKFRNPIFRGPSLHRNNFNQNLTRVNKNITGEKVCFNCGVRGHSPIECPNKNTKLCYNCKKLVSDHVSKNCPERNQFKPTLKKTMKKKKPTQVNIAKLDDGEYEDTEENEYNDMRAMSADSRNSNEASDINW